MKNHLTVSKYIEELARTGQFSFTFKSIVDGLSIKEASLSVSLSRLSKKGKIKMIRKGFGIITSQTNGVLHPSYFLESMMSFLGAKYYVAILTAASYWGASHQSAMVYYVVADKVIKPVDLGKLKIEFITKNNLSEISNIERVAGVGGYYMISTPELTAIDLIRFPKKSGHLNNVATILQDLIEKMDFRKLLQLCKKENVPTSIIQRLGFILDVVLGQTREASILESALRKRRIKPVLLSTINKKENDALSSYSLNEKWMVYQNTKVEPD